jgi:hypothetical protein
MHVGFENLVVLDKVKQSVNVTDQAAKGWQRIKFKSTFHLKPIVILQT